MRGNENSLPLEGACRLIKIYYLHRTNMPKVFNALFKAFLTGIKGLSFEPSNPSEAASINKIMGVINLSFPIPQSVVAVKFGSYERLLPNLFLRVYGYQIPGERYPRSTALNAAFDTTLDYIFKNISIGIIGRSTLLKNFQNVDGLYQKLIILQSSLRANETDMTNRVAIYFDTVYTAYLSLLGDNLLMGKLGILASPIDQRLQAIGRKLNVNVVSNPQAYFDLAESMEKFLQIVESTEWSIKEAQRLYYPPLDAFFKMLFSAYTPVWGIDYLQVAAQTIRQILEGQTSIS